MLTTGNPRFQAWHGLPLLALSALSHAACSSGSESQQALVAAGASAFAGAGNGSGGSGQASAGSSGVGGASAGSGVGGSGGGCSFSMCGGQCVDLQKDAANCGVCGTACSGGTACVAGQCQCPIGQTSCNGQCSTLNTKDHCGSCSQACAAGQICAVTSCIAEDQPCPTGLTRCGDACVDLQTTPSTCGGCDTACAPSQSCVLGNCMCAPGDASCSGGPLLLSVGPTRHYLINGAGAPFQLRGDSPWTMPVQLSREQVDAYLENRKAKKFNTILVEVIETKFGSKAPANFNGDQPFVGGDFTKPNEPYWQHVDYIVSAAAARGVVVLMCALYLGFGGGDEGWYAEASAAGTSAIQSYGAFLGARYTGADNIVWVNGGDFRPPTLDIPNALAAGILSKDKRHLFSTHWGRNSSGTDGAPNWLTLGSSYTEQANISSRVLADYQAAPALPTFLIEAFYEGDLEGQPKLSTAGIRQQAWHALLSGAAGYQYGHHTVWPFRSGWEAALNSEGAQSMAQLNGFMSGLSWWKLVPDAGSKLVTAGRGNIGTVDYVAAALASDGTLGVAYVPNGREITVDMAQLKSSVSARYFDPGAGSFSAVPGSPFANSGAQKLDPPGTTDAVVVLEAN